MNRSAFIKGRSLHKNFMLVRQVARKLHSNKIDSVVFKIDIARAFGSLSWPFLFKVLQSKGFNTKWMGWLSILLFTASMEILVNGSPTRKIFFARGLRQGGPISPSYFVIAMEMLSVLFEKASETGLLDVLPGISARQKILVYADDVVMFFKPSSLDLLVVRNTLALFEEASGTSC